MQYRVNNIAKLRELDSARVPVLSQARIEGPWGIWGEVRVNVLGSNLALERLAANVRDVSKT
jgi:K+-transporting ATPase c subunit